MSRRPADRKPAAKPPASGKFLVRALAVACVGLFLADAVYHKHPYFAAEYLFGFYPIVGFAICVALVLGAKWMRTVVMRKEDYYDDD